MKNIEEIEKMVLAGTKNGVIRVGVLHEPYGAKVLVWLLWLFHCKKMRLSLIGKFTFRWKILMVL